MKEHNYNYSGKNFEIDVSDNGYILSVNGRGLKSVKVYRFFSELVNDIAQEAGVKNIGETLQIISNEKNKDR